MAKGNQLAASLGGHDSGDTGHRQHLPFGNRSVGDGSEGCGLESHEPLGQCLAIGKWLATDIHHLGAAFFVHVTKVLLGHNCTVTSMFDAIRTASCTE